MEVTFSVDSKMNELICNNIGIERISDIIEGDICYLRIDNEDFYINIVYKLSVKFTVKGNIRLEDIEIVDLYSSNIEKAKKLLEWINENADKIEEMYNYKDIGYMFPIVMRSRFNTENNYIEIFKNLSKKID